MTAYYKWKWCIFSDNVKRKVNRSMLDLQYCSTHLPEQAMTVGIIPYICDLCSVLSMTTSHYVCGLSQSFPAPQSRLSSETHTDGSEKRESREKKRREQRTIGGSIFDPLVIMGFLRCELANCNLESCRCLSYLGEQHLPSCFSGHGG